MAQAKYKDILLGKSEQIKFPEFHDNIDGLRVFCGLILSGTFLFAFLLTNCISESYLKNKLNG